jgi:hypothetical protein
MYAEYPISKRSLEYLISQRSNYDKNRFMTISISYVKLLILILYFLSRTDFYQCCIKEWERTRQIKLPDLRHRAFEFSKCKKKKTNKKTFFCKQWIVCGLKYTIIVISKSIMFWLIICVKNGHLFLVFVEWGVDVLTKGNW